MNSSFVRSRSISPTVEPLLNNAPVGAIKEVKGIKDEGKAPKTVNVREVKEQAQAARAKKLEGIAGGASR